MAWGTLVPQDLCQTSNRHIQQWNCDEAINGNQAALVTLGNQPDPA